MATETYKYEFGSVVYLPTWTLQAKQHDCLVCGGTGRIVVPGSDHTATCPEPKCRHGKVTTGSRNDVGVQQLTIREVQIEHTGERQEWDDDAGEQATIPAERTVRYMADETGVGSGSLHDERWLFERREDALACAESVKQYRYPLNALRGDIDRAVLLETLDRPVSQEEA